MDVAEQPRNAGQKLIEEVISLERRHSSIREQLDQLMGPSAVPDFGHDEWQSDISSLLLGLRELRTSIDEKKRRLEIEDPEQVCNVRGREFIADRLSAQALKMRLRESLKARKSELQRLQQGLAPSSSSGTHRNDIPPR